LGDFTTLWGLYFEESKCKKVKFRFSFIDQNENIMLLNPNGKQMDKKIPIPILI
jgi:hypothetical protein